MCPPSLRANIAALSGLQLANYVIPLVTVPYLARVLGVAGWGQLAFVISILQFFVILTNFGFTWSAVSQIAAARDDGKLVTRIFTATWVSQWLLLGVAAVTLAIFVFTVPALQHNWESFVVGFVAVIGNVLFPVWLLQGLERLREVAIIQIVAKSVLIIPLLIFVRTPDDVVLAIFLQSSSNLLAGVGCLYWMANQNITQWHLPTPADVSMALKRGTALFFSRVWISFYSTMIPVLLGLLSGPAAVGLYDLSDKARTAATYIMNPVSEALFPRMSHLISRDQRGARQLFRKSVIVTVLLAGFVSSALFFGADWIVTFLGGDEFRDASTVLRYLSPVPMLVGLSNVFGVQLMIPMGRTKAFNSILATAGILTLVMTFPLIKCLDAIGAAITRTLAELCVALLMGMYIKRSQFLK